MDASFHGIWNTVRYLVILGGGFYIFIVALVYFMQSHLIYNPSGTVDATPASIGLDFERISLVTSDGITLSSWYVPHDTDGPVVLFCHGNAGNMSHRLETINLLHRLGLGVFIFDYRGYGESDGRPSEQGTYRDAATAWDWLCNTRGIPPERIVIMGRSLGGAVASWLASERHARAVVLESTFTSIADMGKALYPGLSFKHLLRYNYASIARVVDIHSPLLVIHSPDDDIVPYALGKRLFEAANEPKVFLEITGGHNSGFLDSGERYISGLKSFFERYVTDDDERG